MNSDDFKAKMDKCENPADYFKLFGEQMGLLVKRRPSRQKKDLLVIQRVPKSFMIMQRAT